MVAISTVFAVPHFRNEMIILGVIYNIIYLYIVCDDMPSNRTVHPLSNSLPNTLSGASVMTQHPPISKPPPIPTSFYKFLINKKHNEKYPNKKLPLTTIDIPEVEVVTTGCFIGCKLC